MTEGWYKIVTPRKKIHDIHVRCGAEIWSMRRPAVSVDTYREDPLYPRIVRAVAAILQRGKVVAPVDVLIKMNPNIPNTGNGTGTVRETRPLPLQNPGAGRRGGCSRVHLHRSRRQRCDRAGGKRW